MKIRTTKYVIKEGFVSAYRNKLMSLASVGIVTASLIVFGFFIIFSLNISQNADDSLQRQAEIEVFCNHNWDDAQAVQVEEAIKKNDDVKKYRKVSKREALERAKDMLGDDRGVLDGYDNDYSFMPISFIVELNNPYKSAEIVNEFWKINGVEDIRYQEAAVDLLSNAAYWAKVVSVFLAIVLLIVSTFIISNTIKLTVFARRKEISIMKYIGATDWFIRLPFIVEGVVIGFAGALIAFSITFLCYNTLESKSGGEFYGYYINLIKMSSIGLQVFIANSLIGMFVGGIGSAMSIRKYLRV